MFSKRNHMALQRSMAAVRQRYALRKLSIGFVSVILGLTFVSVGHASADDATGPASSQAVAETTAVVTSTAGHDSETLGNDQLNIGQQNGGQLAVSTASAAIANATSSQPAQVNQQDLIAQPGSSSQADQSATAPAPSTVNNEPTEAIVESSPQDPVMPSESQTVDVVLKVLDTDNDNQLVQTIPVSGQVGSTIPYWKYEDQLLNNNLTLVDPDAKYQIQYAGQVLVIYVKHAIEERVETQVFEQVIYGTYPDGQLVYLDRQTVSFTRNIVIDKFTNKWTYGEWSAAEQKFADFTVQVPGYSASEKVVMGATVQPGSADRQLERFVELRANQVKEESRPVTRTINLQLPDGTTRQVVQTATFTRQVVYDPFTGEAIEFGPWSAEQLILDSYVPEEIDGWKPSTTVEAAVVTPDMADWTVDVTYESAGTQQPETGESSGDPVAGTDKSDPSSDQAASHQPVASQGEAAAQPVSGAQATGQQAKLATVESTMPDSTSRHNQLPATGGQYRQSLMVAGMVLGLVTITAQLALAARRGRRPNH